MCTEAQTCTALQKETILLFLSPLLFIVQFRDEKNIGTDS